MLEVLVFVVVVYFIYKKIRDKTAKFIEKELAESVYENGKSSESESEKSSS